MSDSVSKAKDARSWGSKLIFLLRLGLRLAGGLALAGFGTIAGVVWWESYHARPASIKTEDYVYVLNHGELGKVTHIERVVHAEKQGASVFVELEVVPFPEEALNASKIDKMTESGWMHFAELDPTIASLARQIAARARASKCEWFPDADRLSSERIRLNLWSGSLKHGEINTGYLIVCDREAQRIFAADLKTP